MLFAILMGVGMGASVLGVPLFMITVVEPFIEPKSVDRVAMHKPATRVK